MLLFCPNCGRRFEIPGHTEATAAQKCPSCGFEFGGPKAGEEPPAPAGKLKFTSGGETDVVAVRQGQMSGQVVGEERAASPARTSPLPGVSRPARRVDPATCELGAELGRQGAGILYEGRDPESDESVLVRHLLPEGAAVVDAERWATAATKLQGLTHPRIATVLGVGLREGSPHVVTERVDGQNLAEVSGGRPLNLRQVTEFAFQIVEALSAAHGSGTLHGDLKPSNVIIDPQGRARVCDFGFVPRAVEAGEPVDSPHVLGWLPFAPPEAVRDGPEAVTERSDSYGLGALVYFMLTGRPPFAAETDARTLVAEVLEGRPSSPSSVNPKVPPALDALVMRTLEKDPSHRPANAQAVALELRKIEREGRAAQVPERRAPRRWPKVFLGFVILAGIGYGGYYLYNELRVKGALGRAEGYTKEARKLLASCETDETGDRPEPAVEPTAELYDEVIGLYRSAVEEAEGTPELPKFQLELAKLFLKLDRPDDAAQLLEGAAGAKVPEGAEARALLPPALARAGEAAKAKSALGRLEAAGDPAVAVVRSGVETGEALLGAGSAPAAAEILEHISELAARAGVPALGVDAALGNAYAALDEKEKARRAFARALKSSEGDEARRARAALGLVRLIEPGDPDFELTPDEEETLAASPLAQILYVRALVARGTVDRAKAVVGETVAAERADATILAWRGLAHGEVMEASGDLEGARSHFAGAERVSSESTDLVEVAGLACVGLARLDLRAGQAASALAAFQDCARRYSKKPGARSAVAWALVGQGDALRLVGKFEQAARQYREALPAFSTDVPYRAEREQYLAALCGLGEVAMEIRDRVRMRNEFKRLAAEKGAGFYGKIARGMTGEFTEAELADAAAHQTRDLAARACYCLALKRDLAGDAEGADEMFRRTVDTAAGLSWYGAAAAERLKR